VTGNRDMGLHEVHEASTLIQEQAHEDAKIIWGLVYDESMENSMRITVIATGFEEKVAVDEEPSETLKGGRLFETGDMPPFMKKKISIDYKEIKTKSEMVDLDDERYDIPTFLRKQAD